MMELKIVGGIDSIVGFAEHSAKDGETVSIRTQGSYFSKSDLNDPSILSIKNQISSIMASHVFPLFLSHFSSKNLPEKFHIDSVRIELFADSSKNTFTFNQDAKILGNFVLAEPKAFKKGDPVFQKDIKEINSVHIEDRDPNSALMLFVLFSDEWYGVIDLIYNRENALGKHEAAQEYIETAMSNFKNSKFKPFYNDLWTAYELLTESILLLHNQLKLKDSHKKISKLLKGFCEIHNLHFYDDYKQIEFIRTSVRYGPPYKKQSDMEQNALKYLTSLMDFSKHVESFLKERQVSTKIPDSINMQQSDILKK